MAKKREYRVTKRKPAKRLRDAAAPLLVPTMVYTLQEACRVLRISEATARRWIKSGRLAARKIGRDYRLLGSDLEAQLQVQEPGIKLFGPGNPLLAFLGVADSGVTDVSSRHHDYLAEAYADLHDGDESR